MKLWKNGKNENIPKAVIFQAIYSLSSQHHIETLCKITQLSQSGYYTHKQLIVSWRTKQKREQEDLAQIQTVCEKYKRKYGYRMVTMKLVQQWVHFNHKKVYRFMNKYNLLAKIRKRNPYKQIHHTTQEHSTKKNILSRQFRWVTPLQKLWTDITYIKLQQTWCYLSIVKDMITWEILSHSLSKTLNMWATLTSIEILEGKYWDELTWMLLHSDQWWHYTHPSYQLKLEQLAIVQSMSRKGNCLDNAPTESFFWHFKDEIEIEQMQSFEELVKYIDNYIFEYNNQRPQWNKKKMTPVQYRIHLLKTQTND